MRVSGAYLTPAVIFMATALVVPLGADASRSANAAACSAKVHHDVLPVWMRSGFSGAKPRMPYVLGEHGLIGGVLFGSPLNAPPAQNKNNKILWVPRRSSKSAAALWIRMQKMDGNQPAGTPVRRIVTNGPGPSQVDAPSAGCWRLTLSWSGRRDTLDLAYVGPTSPGPVSTGVDIWGQPDRSQEVADRPLGTTLAVFREGTATKLPRPTGPMRPLSVVAAHLRGNPGALVLSKTRRIATAAGPVYLVPTIHGWLCVQGPTFRTCHQGLLRQGLTWNFYSTSAGLDVIGIAANNVSAVTLTWGSNRRPAHLARNVFFVQRPLSITSATALPPLGRLAVRYRGTRAPATVPLQ